MKRPVLYGQKIGVVIPAYNEEERIGRTLSRLPTTVDAVVVVDDASRDATVETVMERAEARVTVIRHRANRGVGAAIATGYRELEALGLDVYVVMAGDDQMDPADLPELVRPLAMGSFDYVKGNRFLHAEWRKMPRLRRFGSRFLALVTNCLGDLKIDDSQCGYTALRASVARSLPLEELWPRYGYPNDLLLLLRRGGFRVGEVPVRPVYAGEASGLRPYHLLTILYVIVRRTLRRPPSRV